ncbi:MAG: flagellar hook-basal body complex protein [Deltaproteobacteria bacterium]|nr:flagellar hook-basal body complex protein [Deltaproteobacteria bacterium]
MALSSALFSGISGLSNLGNAMQIIGDNIANINTVGFKGSTFTFQDLLSQAMFTRAGTSQVGRGTALADIYATFEQGSFESTGNNTDLAIGGDGFFAVREATSESLFYTRAGNFRFDKDGNLVNPEGYVVQGWSVDANGAIEGSADDISLKSFTSEPEATAEITIITNVDKDQSSNSSILSSSWDGTATTPLASINYEYQSTVKAYDSLGSTHDITVYYDKLSGSVWEYLVTCNPDEDLRSGIKDTKGAGLLARGRVTYNEGSGALSSLTMSRLTGYTIATPGTGQSATDAESGSFGGDFTITVNNPDALTYVTGAGLSTMTLTYDLGTTSWDGISLDNNYDDKVILSSSATQIEVDLDGSGTADITIDITSGTLADDDDIEIDLQGSGDWAVQTTTNLNNDGYYQFQTDFLGGASTTQDIAFDIGTRWDGTSFAPDSLASTQYASSSTTVFQSAGGYGAGALQGVDVDVEGLITGVYSNGQVLPLYRIALAKFQSVQGLFKEGGNLYRETRQSGPATTALPGTNGLGNIAPNSLEQSNVDIATEFVKMITTQRGFQANSKIITVTDQMLAELINLKR